MTKKSPTQKQVIDDTAISYANLSWGEWLYNSFGSYFY